MRRTQIIESCHIDFKPKSTILFLFLITIVLQSNIMPLAAQQQTEPQKSPELATALAFLGTAVPITTAIISDDFTTELVMLTGGIIFGPVAGYMYMDEPIVGLKYGSTRALILGGTIGSMYFVCTTGDCRMNLFGEEEGGQLGIAMTIAFIGFSATIIHNVVDIFSVNHRVRSHNQRISVRPTYFHKTNTWGLSAKWRF